MGEQTGHQSEEEMIFLAPESMMSRHNNNSNISHNTIKSATDDKKNGSHNSSSDDEREGKRVNRPSSPEQFSSLHSMQTSPDVVAPIESRHRRTSSFFRRDSVIKAPPDLLKIREYFQACMAPNNRIQTRIYIQAYKEVAKFLNVLGVLLSFASRDVEQKVTRIEDKLASENKMHYRFLDDILKFEMERNIVDKEGKETRRAKFSHSGTRNMFRLHQALAFLVQFFTNVRTLSNSKMQHIVNEAYKHTISKNHGWIIRKTAGLAFHAIPSRNNLISRMGDDVTEQQVLERLGEIAEVAKKVYAVSAQAFSEISHIADSEPLTLEEQPHRRH